MKLTKYIELALLPMFVFTACSDDAITENVENQTLTISSSITPFCVEEGAMTRTNLAGDAFDNNDMIRLKVICPFVNGSQLGESTWTGSKDNFWLLKWSGSNWITLPASDLYDINGSYSSSGGANIFGIYEAQATPYVYTAITWTEEKMIRDSDGDLYDYYANVFHADQSREKNYKASDLLWAQQFTQTGAWNIRLSFNHVMSALLITIDDSTLDTKISSDAVLTLEGMPAIDQAEVIVGDYYAAKDKSSYRYGYKAKAKCDYGNNGLVIGVVGEKSNVHPFTGGIPDSNVTLAAVPNTATYTCYHVPGTKQYRLVVPPCELESNAEFWLRDDTRRYKMTLYRKEFKQGKLYNITMKVGSSGNSNS